VIKSFPLLGAAVVALGVTGCLASKGDIRLLQDELRATRAAVARSDSAHRRESDSLAAALAALASAQASGDQALQRALQSTDTKLGDLANRSRNFELTTAEKFKGLNDDVAQVQELARQNMRGVTAARAVAEQVAAAPGTPPTAPGDSTTRQPAPVAPGPATLLLAGNAGILQGSCRAARRSYEELLRQFPTSLEAPEAQYKIGESFVSCPEGGNPAAADSVYTLVTTRYPKSDFAAISLYKRSDMQMKAGKTDVARSLLQRIVCEYPKSTVYPLATEKLGNPSRCK
jgi:TolA-binding protein